MTGQSLASWLARFIALWVLMFLASGIPFSVIGMMYGSFSATLAAIILASLLHMWKPRDHLKSLLVIYVVLGILSGLFIIQIANAG
jgi:hypothetical protein|tara:strand:- start:289 stop:546 length:258 start_codon:yes stop_codon:yes gene_type:complete